MAKNAAAPSEIMDLCYNNFCMAGAPFAPRCRGKQGGHVKKENQKAGRSFLLVLLLAAALGTVSCKKTELLTLSGEPEAGQSREALSPPAEETSADRDGTAAKGYAAVAERDAAEGSAASDKSAAGEEAAAAGTAERAETEQNADPIYVYVCGAVENPGVYTFAEGTRVCDAISAAGGMTAQADETCVNQALLLSDQDQVYIRTQEERDEETSEGAGKAGISSGAESRAAVSSGSRQESTGTVGRINLNTASEEELRTLPGIGESKARAIAAYRSEHGSFARTEDLMQVSGIGTSTYEKLKAMITVDGME